MDSAVLAPSPFRALQHVCVSVVSGQEPPAPTSLLVLALFMWSCPLFAVKYRVSIELGALTIAATLQFGANPLFT